MYRNGIDKYGDSFTDVVLSSISDGVIAMDRHSKVIYMNKRAEKILGWKAGEAYGKDLFNVFPAFETIRTQKETGLGHKTIIITKDGRQKYISANRSVIKKPSGDINCIVIVFRYITGRKNKGTTLIKHEHHSKDISNQVPCLIYKTDKEMKCIYVNKRWGSFAGLEPKKIMDSGWENLVLHPDDLSRYLQLQDRALRKRKPYQMGFRLRRYDGEYRWCLLETWPCYETDGHFVGYIGSIHDVSRHKEAQEKIYEELTMYRSLFMNLHSGYIFFNTIQDKRGNLTDLKFIEVNRAYERMLKKPRKHIIGKLCTQLFPKDKDTLLNAIKKYYDVLTHGKSVHIDEIYINSINKWCALSIYSLKKTNIVAIITDIDHRKESELDLKKAREKAEAANKAKSEFLANMSHEIRTSINSIVGMVDLTLLTGLNEEQKENLGIVKSSVNTLLNIIDDILDFSKMEAGRLAIENTNFNIVKLMDGIIKGHSSQASNKGLELNYTFSSTIPNIMVGDPNRISQVLNNLISNAIKFTDQGSVNVRVGNVAEMDDEVELRFTIQDTGIGISPEDAKHIFEGFSQADSSHTKRFSGTGLGLTISKQLVEMMGGKIGVESEIGKGSSFYFILKLKAGTHVKDAISREPNIWESPKKANILLVEDHINSQKIIKKMLEGKGHKVTIANNGIEALDLFMPREYDLILMDIQMPNMNGIETTKRIREIDDKNRVTPIIAMTAYALKGDKERFLKLGMDEYIAKPIQMDKLFSIIDKVLVERRVIEDSMPDKVIITEDGEVIFVNEDQCGQKEEIKPILNGIKKHIDELDLCISNGELIPIEGIAHRIKVMSDDIDASAIKTLAFKIELSARRGDIAGIITETERIKDEFNMYKVSIMQLKDGGNW